MAKTSGGTRPNREGGLKVGDDNFKGKTGMPQSLKTIQNKAVYDAVMDAISRYHSVLGVRQKKVKLADLPEGYGGVHVTRNGDSEGIYLNKAIFQPAERAAAASPLMPKSRAALWRSVSPLRS